MKIGLGLGFGENFVSCVRATDPNKERVFRSDVANDVTLTFAPILAADQDIDQRGCDPRVKS